MTEAEVEICRCSCRDAYYSALKGEISGKQAQHVAKDMGLKFLDEYHFKPLPTIPEKFSKWQKMTRAEKESLSDKERKRIYDKVYPYVEQRERIERENESNKYWLSELYDHAKETNRPVEAEHIKSLLINHGHYHATQSF